MFAVITSTHEMHLTSRDDKQKGGSTRGHPESSTLGISH